MLGLEDWCSEGGEEGGEIGRERRGCEGHHEGAEDGHRCCVHRERKLWNR